MRDVLHGVTGTFHVAGVAWIIIGKHQGSERGLINVFREFRGFLQLLNGLSSPEA